MENSASGMGNVWTIKRLLDWTQGYLSDKGIATARLDSELLLAHVLSCNRIDLYLQFDRPFNSRELTTYRGLVQRRAKRQPMGHLIGEVGFWTLQVRVSENCFLPSQDSETLVQMVLDAVQEIRTQRSAAPEPLTILELGTGSGVLPLAVCTSIGGLRWIAIERSERALPVALENRGRYARQLEKRGSQLHLLQGDRFKAVSTSFQPDLIVSNPPYIPSGTIDRLMPEVAKGQPRMALDGGARGIDFHRYLIEYGARCLRPGGHILLEMGAEQSRALRALSHQIAGVSVAEIRKDLAGHPRGLHLIKAAPQG